MYNQRPTTNDQPLVILGIETSCDDTAAAVVRSDGTILSSVVHSQIEDHAPYGGVVPEIASRAHIHWLEPVMRRALEEAKISMEEIDAVAATTGPGLIGGVIVGTMTGKAIAAALGKPFIAVNHLEGHALTCCLTDDVPFPFLLFLASGGHCQFLIVHDVGKYTRLGGTMDDALGEAYDKVAKLLKLGLPGGPKVEALAKQGNPHAFPFTVPMKGRAGCDLSFSGLKTAVREAVAGGSANPADICASFQRVATESVLDRVENAISQFKGKHFVLAGGVAANQYLRSALQQKVESHGLTFVVPPPKLCTDNAAMIAWSGAMRLMRGETDGLDTAPRARWPLA